MDSTVARTSALKPVEANISRGLRTLIAYHDISKQDVADVLSYSVDTVDRRIKRGGWLSTEIEVLTAYFTVTRDGLLDGDLDLASSHIDPQAAQALSMYLRQASDLAFSAA